MDARAVLRERGRWTRAAILSMLIEHPGLSRSAAAKALGLTVQAVSMQAQQLVHDGLAHDDDGLHITPTGIELLHQDADALTAAAHGLRTPLSGAEVISAIAATDIPAGQMVGLWMRDGDLVADPAAIGESHGVATHAARIGDEVGIGHPKGIVAFTPGTIDVMRVPEPSQGGVASVDRRALGKTTALVAAVGTGATILARAHGHLDIAYAGAEGALNAAQRGLHVRLYVSGDQVADVLRVLESGNRGPSRVDVRIVDAPTK